jgi:hypothetical protein
MNLGDWLGEQARSFREDDDQPRLRMIRCYIHGYDARERDPDQALAAFQEGRRQAEALGEPWWVLFYQNECIEAFLHFKRDYRPVLDLAMQCVMDLRKPSNTHYPGRFSVWDSLVASYLGIDAEGYEEPIQQALDHLDREIPPEPDGGRYLLLARRRIFALELDRLKDAYDSCMRELQLAASDKDQSRAVHFATFTYCGLCQVAGAAGLWDALKDWAATGEELAREVEHQCELGEVLAWQAVAALHTGDADKARRTHHNATTLMGRLKMPPKRGYFDALIDYHVYLGELENALAVREAELAAILDRGRLLYETRVRIERARLRARLTQLTPDDLEQARRAAQRLRKPERHLDEIEQIAAEG